MNEPKPLPSETKLVEAKFKIGDQWYYRGNRSPMWLFCASRLDGSMCGIAETVPHDWYPLLEALASLADELRLARERCAELERLLREVYGEFAKRHIRATDLQNRIDAALRDAAASGPKE